jgi:hypothetical protein
MPADTRDLYAQIADHAELVTLEDAAHDGLLAAQPEQYATAVLHLLHEVEARARGKSARPR